jgi:hypothetical protein
MKHYEILWTIRIESEIRKTDQLSTIADIMHKYKAKNYPTTGLGKTLGLQEVGAHRIS